VVKDHNKYLLLRIIFDNTSDKLQYPTENSINLQQISIASKKSEMNRFFKKPITKKSKTDVNPTDEQPENTIPASSDGAKIPTVKKRHSSTGKAPDPDTVVRATPSGKPPAKPQYVIPRCNPMEENPLSVLPEVLLTEEERLAQARPLTLPPEAKLALETLRTASNWREAVAAFKVDWQINNEDRNRTFHEHNHLRVLKLLEEYRAGTHDVVCDNLAQFYLVKEVVDDYQQARRKAKLDQEAQLEHQKWLLREKLSGKSALFSESQPQARPDPFLGTRATPVGGKFPAGRPDANPLTGARSTPGGGKFPAGGPDECLSPATVPDGSYSPVDESVASPVVGAGVGQGVSTPSGDPQPPPIIRGSTNRVCRKLELDRDQIGGMGECDYGGTYPSVALAGETDTVDTGG